MAKANKKVKAPDTVDTTTVDTTNDTASESAAAEKKPVEKLDIINGRMPLAIVYVIRFKEAADAKDGDLATKYKTSTGKINDIRKNRNFAYVTDGMAFTQADINAANSHLEKVTVKGNHFTDDEKNDISAKVESLPISEDAAAKIVEARKSVRKAKEPEAGAEGEEAASETEGGGSDEGDLDSAI